MLQDNVSVFQIKRREGQVNGPKLVLAIRNEIGVQLAGVFCRLLTGDQGVFEIGKDIINKILNFTVGKSVQKFVIDDEKISFKLKFQFHQLDQVVKEVVGVPMAVVFPFVNSNRFFHRVDPSIRLLSWYIHEPH